MHLDFDGFVDAVVHGGDQWFTHLESWWPHREDPNVLHVRYEDLVKDLEAGVRRIAAFCDLPIDEARMGDILQRSGFQYMKEHNDRFDFRFTWNDADGPKDGFIRKGGVGGAKARLSPEQSAALERKVEDYRRKLGISGEAL
jgi:hypothetical protein